ncbi:MAG: hypothetical protein LBH54_03265, partial [Clostridiales bacterium]|nr:hypothetical protein [Clostridiales bacterium]
MSIAEIVIANTARATDKTFHYSVPDGMALSAGMRVLVPFGAGNRTTEGIVVGFAEQSAYGSLKAVMKILDERPLLNGAMLSLAKWMREKYLCTFYQALKTVMPSGISVKTTEWITVLDGTAVPKSASERAVLERIKDAGGTADFGTVSDLPGARRAVNALNARGIVSRDEETAQSVKAKQIRMVSIGGETDVEALYKKAPKQAKMLEILRQTGAISAADLVAFSGGSYGAVNALRDKGLVIFEDRTVLRTAYRGDGFAKTVPLPPTAEQEKVLRYLNAAFDAGETTP